MDMSADSARPRASMPTIGFLIHDVAGGYQFLVLSGVADRAKEQGLNLICFAGGEFNAPQDYYSQRNILFDFITDKNVDGLIIIGAISNYISLDAAKAFYEHFCLPVVSLSLEFNGIPSVMADNYAGMRDVIRHVIEVHGRRRIAFIQGVEGNPDADQRYAAYLDELAKHDLPFDPALVIRADFFMLQSIQGVYTLLDERKVSFDALVAANDTMAIGALEALQNRGIRVPDDVAVVGFDNIDEASSTISPLTTVEQPLYEMGRQAVDLLVKQLKKQPVPERVALPTLPVIRQSCGCFSQAALQARAEQVIATNDTIETLLTRHRQDILVTLSQVIGNAARVITLTDLEDLLEAVSRELIGGHTGLFLSALDQIGRKFILKGVEPGPLQQVISILRRYVLSANVDTQMLRNVENLWQQSRVLLAEIFQRTQAYHSLQITQQAQTLVEVMRDLVNSSDLETYMNILAANLPRLGIEACYLALYEHDKNPSPEWSRLMMAYDRRGRADLEPGGRRFPTTQLIPEDMVRPDGPHQFLIEALHFQEQQFGFVIFELSKYKTLLYEELRHQLSSILKGVFVLDEHKKIEANLVELNQLKTEFISTAAHELRTPLTSIQGFSEILLTRDLDDDRKRRYVTMINQQAGHLAIIINDLLDISRLETKRKLEFAIQTIDMGELVNLVVSTFGETSQKHHIEILDLNNCPPVVGDPFRITQVLDNLVSNAIKYSPNGGKITIRGETVAGYFQTSVQDQGIGITAEQQAHLFEKFYRANASNTSINGTGLGLAISKLIIELLGGKIWAESRPGTGTTFFFTLPLVETTSSDETVALPSNEQTQ